MRSLLFVPGDSERKLLKAGSSGADALILDLEDSVAQSRKADARQTVAGYLDSAKGQSKTPRLVVRINALDTGLTDDDLGAIVRGAPAAILLPKASCGADIQDLSARLSVHEADAGLPEGQIAIHALMTETAAGMLAAASFASKSARLEAVAWGAEDLAADIGAASNRDETGRYTDVFRLARSLTILAAAHCAVEAIDTVFTDFRDSEGLERECHAAVRDGFSGKMAIHPDQVAVINTAFTPAPEDVERAVRILALFAAAGPGAGVLSLDGKMIDKPHLRQAERVARRAGLEPGSLPDLG
ncbi:CoA ester lyase [Hoeflea sp. YIM 152468]|uniref:HpcH/HpaI aldolase/citrate lyase family protein n=1 Tax=Hoeflea sp. YIM 152468 TaxID=3031759 RepID=UPI0023DC268D|nr:CoA ester lyase [Hoeflea sp. YIM 152468]MDF1610005.1 CoA ester lyase [Hoeflea sp. YIM 152468]